MAKTASARGQQQPPPPPSASSVSSTPSTFDPDDCVMVEPPAERPLSVASRDPNPARQSVGMESENDEEGSDIGDEDDASATAMIAIASSSRKRPGSAMVQGPAKRAKAAPVTYVRQAPSGKGEDYDDLCHRANQWAKKISHENAQQAQELVILETQRDEAFVKVSTLERKILSRKQTQAAKDAVMAAEIKAAVQEMKVVLRGEWEKKHKDANQTKDQRHKSEMARCKGQAAADREKRKAAEAKAKDRLPEHSMILKKRDKTIENFKTVQNTLEQTVDDLKHQIGQLKTHKDKLCQAYSNKSEESDRLKDEVKKAETDVVKANTVIGSYKTEMGTLKRLHAEEKKTLGRKWQIQYDNAQESARRGSEVQRSVFPLTTALNQAVEKRTELEGKVRTAEDKLKTAEAEILLLRKKGEQAGECRNGN